MQVPAVGRPMQQQAGTPPPSPGCGTLPRCPATSSTCAARVVGGPGLVPSIRKLHKQAELSASPQLQEHTHPQLGHQLVVLMLTLR